MDRIQRQSRIGLAVMAGKREIREDVERGIVPAEVGSFSELHDYVDANGYGGLFDWVPEESGTMSDEDVDDANAVQDALDRWIKAGALRWTVAAVDLAGIGRNDREWLAEYQPGVRWNGWIGFPYFDALTVVDILDFINDNPDDPENYYGYDWDFDGEVLVIEDRQFREEYPDDFQPERIEPTEDGFYSLGAYGWVWSEA